MILESQILKLYFPEDPVSQCDRQFMLDVINTVDPNFFGKVMTEYDVFQHSIAKQNNQVISIDSKLFEVLNKLTNNFQSKTAKCATSKFQLPIKKRKRPERRPMPELKAKINLDDSVIVQKKHRFKYH